MILRQMPVLSFDLNLTSTDYTMVFEEGWTPMQGVREIALMMDLRTIVQGTGGSAILVVPALQLAVSRTDRPQDGSIISGTARATVDSYKYLESLASHTDKAFLRRGVAGKLTSGSFARTHVLLHGACRQMSRIFPAEEIWFNPTNDNGLVSLFPLCGGVPIQTVGVDKAVFVIFGMGNDTGSTMVYQFYARAFNDPLARGDWTPIGSTATPNALNFSANTGELSLSGLSLSSYMWVEFALGVYKSAGNPSRCIFHVIPAVTYV